MAVHWTEGDAFVTLNSVWLEQIWSIYYGCRRCFRNTDKMRYSCHPFRIRKRPKYKHRDAFNTNLVNYVRSSKGTDKWMNEDRTISKNRFVNSFPKCVLRWIIHCWVDIIPSTDKHKFSVVHLPVNSTQAGVRGLMCNYRIQLEGFFA